MTHDEDPSTKETRRPCIKTAGVATTGLFAFSGSAPAHGKDDRRTRFPWLPTRIQGREETKTPREDYHAGYDFGKKNDRDDGRKKDDDGHHHEKDKM